MYFGMKGHIGADAESGLVHMVRGTSGNVSVSGNPAALLPYDSNPCRSERNGLSAKACFHNRGVSWCT